MRRALLAGALLLATASGAAAAEDPIRALSDRADDLLDRLYEDHGDGPLLEQAAALREECLAAGATGVAEKLQGQIVFHRPASAADRRLHARILVSRGRVDAAVRDLRNLVREIPTDCQGHGMLADLLRAEGDVAGALEAHEAHLREHADEAGPLSAVGRLLLWDLRDAEGARGAAARMRRAADGPRATPATAAFFRREAGFLEAEVERLEKDRAALREAEDRVDGLLHAAFAGFAALLAGAFLATRQRRGGPETAAPPSTPSRPS